MTGLLQPPFTWFFFGLLVLCLGLIYFLLKILYKRANFLTLNRNVQRLVFSVLQKTLIIYEPIAIVVSASVWVLISPVWHGLLVLFLIVITFPHIRNYTTGRIIRMNNDLEAGTNIILGKKQGTVSRLANLGMYIMMNNGLMYLSYDQLAKHGYTIIPGSNLGEYCVVCIQLHQDKDAKQQKQWLLHMLMVAPYIDTSYYPSLVDSQENQVKFKLLLGKGNYHQHLIRLIQDWGYACTLSH